MLIRKEDYQDILDYFVKKRGEGEEYVAFLGGAPVNKDELFMFSAQYDVQEFCHEMSTDLDRYAYMGIRSTYRTMAESAKDNSLRIEKDGLVDVGLMVFMRYQ